MLLDTSETTLKTENLVRQAELKPITHRPGRLPACRLIGNQVMQRLVQTKLAINQPGDRYEEEADRVAEMVVGNGRFASPPITPLVPQGTRKTCACGNMVGAGGECEACRLKRLARQNSALQGSAMTSAPTIVGLNRAEQMLAANVGRPLEPDTKEQFEARFGQDFDQVRIHTDDQAAAAAQALQAKAFTAGKDIAFNRGTYNPNTPSGQKLLAHELVHVVQQRTGIHLKEDSGEGDILQEKQADSAAPVASSNHAANLPSGKEGSNQGTFIPTTSAVIQCAPTSQDKVKEDYSLETKEQFAQRVRDRAASRLTQNVAVLEQWSTYVNAMKGFQLRAQLLTGIATEYALAAAPTPSGRSRFETWSGTQNKAERTYQGSMLDIDATYRERSNNFIGYLASMTQGYNTTPSVAQNLQVLAGDQQAGNLPQTVHVAADPRYSAYAPTIKRIQSGKIGGCQACHEINLAWDRTAKRWGDPLPKGNIWNSPSFTTELGSRSLLSPSTPQMSDQKALIAYIQGLSTTAQQPSQPQTAPTPPTTTPAQPPAADTTAKAAPNPFVPSTAAPKSIPTPPARTDLCGELPPAEDSQRLLNLASWGENSAIVASVISRIDSVLTPLGPRGYRVLGRPNFDALYAMSPDNMEGVRDGIIAQINKRKQQYTELRATIQSGGVPYEELCPIVDELLPGTNEFVKWQVLEDVHKWQRREKVLQVLELTLLALSVIYPPSVVVTIPAGMALGLARISLGMDQQRQGRQWTQGTGSGLYSLSQEAQAPGLASRGRSNIIFGSLSFGLSALSFARMIAQARATAQLLQALEAGAIIRHAQYPGLALLARNGRLLLVTETGEVLGYGMILPNGQLWWTRLSAPMSYGGGAYSATGTSLVPYGSSSMVPFGSSPFGSGAMVPFGSSPFGSSSIVPFGSSPFTSPGIVTPALAGQSVPLTLGLGPRLPLMLGAGPQPRGLLSGPVSGPLIVDAQSGYPDFLYSMVARTPGARGVGIEGGNFIVGYQGIHPTLPQDLAMSQLIARNTPQWGSFRGPGADDPTSLFPGSTTLVPSTQVPGALTVQPIPFTIPSAGEVTVIPQSFFPAYGGLAPAYQGPMLPPDWVMLRPGSSGNLAPTYYGPQKPAWSILRPRLIPQGAKDVVGLTPTQHTELYNQVDQLYMRRPFGLKRASDAEARTLGTEINQMLRPGGFVELRLTYADLPIKKQLPLIQTEIPGSTTITIDNATIKAFREHGTLPADPTQTAILRNAEQDIKKALTPLGQSDIGLIVRIYKPASP